MFTKRHSIAAALVGAAVLALVGTRRHAAPKPAPVHGHPVLPAECSDATPATAKTADHAESPLFDSWFLTGVVTSAIIGMILLLCAPMVQKIGHFSDEATRIGGIGTYIVTSAVLGVVLFTANGAGAKRGK